MDPTAQEILAFFGGVALVFAGIALLIRWAR
jgi:hypothetical protein